MYKKIIILVFIICSTFVVNAQSFKKNDLLIDFGAGFGGSWFTEIEAKPIFNISVENGIVKMSNFISLGIGVFGSSFSYYNGEDEYSLSIIAVKPIFHFAFFNSKTFDFYAGSLVGMAYYQEQTYVGSKLFSHDYIVPYTNILIGARWMLKDNFGLFAELHSFVPVITGGVTLKLGN